MTASEFSEMEKMRPGRKERLFACAIALLAGGIAAAREPVLPPAGLREMTERAWLRHPQAAGLDERDTATRATQELAAALTPQPASISLGNLNDRQGRGLGRQEWEVELALPLWLPGQREAHAAAADRLGDEVAARRAALRLEVAGEVRAAWWSLAAARAVHALAVRRLETAQALDADVRRRFKAGDLSRIDANLAQGEVLAAEAERIDAEAALRRSEQTFRLLSGQAAPPRLDEESPADGGAPTGAHPRLAAVAAAAASAQARATVAAETRRAAPELALRVVRERSGFGEPYGTSIGVRLTLPFSSEAQARREHFAAAAESAQADAGMRRAEVQLRLDGESARHELAAAGRQLAMARERSTLAEDNLRLAEKAFGLGESDLATLLRLRAAARAAESFHELQRIARLAAISRLNQTLGVMP